MRLAQFDYKYPQVLVAHHPLPERDAARMLVCNRYTGTMTHSAVRALPSFLRAGDVLVINTSKVIPARLIGRRESGGRVEVLLLKAQDDSVWHCLATRTNRFQPGVKIAFDEGLEGIVRGRTDDHLLIGFNTNGNFSTIVDQIGLPPLPPYIQRPDGMEPEDRERYQTIYADTPGSAAAPTAGLHFTGSLLETLRARGVIVAPVTLHVGLDTFAPVRVDDITRHRMHGEYYAVPETTRAAVMAAKREGRRIIAVGTTSVRALESEANAITASPVAGRRSPAIISHRHIDTSTHLFIYLGYQFRVVDAVLTNFHQPRSTLLMLVAAFAGLETIQRAYAEAIAKRYRLFSYGDCMFIV